MKKKERKPLIPLDMLDVLDQNEIEKRVKPKWWMFIPVIGTMAYTLILEFFINKGHPKIRKGIKKYRSWYNLATIVISLPFIISFFVLRDTGDWGHWPWFIFVSISIGALGLCVTPLHWFLYNKGLKEVLEADLIAKGNDEIKAAKIIAEQQNIEENLE